MGRPGVRAGSSESPTTTKGARDSLPLVHRVHLPSQGHAQGQRAAGLELAAMGAFTPQ